MALRHVMPDRQLSVDPRADLQPIPAYPVPEVIEFRRGADVVRVAREVLQKVSVKIDAAVGAGKSVRFPSALVTAGAVAVYHVLPSRLLAVDLFDYVSTQSAVPSSLFVGDSGVPGDESLVIADAAAIVHSLLAGWRPPSHAPLVLDEAHESDAYTYFLRTLGRSLGFSVVVQMSATWSTSGFRAAEGMPGEVRSETFPESESPEAWDLCAVGKPWSVSSLSGNVLVFTDVDTHAKKLVGEYRSLGLLAHRLTSRMSVADFRAAMRDVRDEKGPLVALVADSSFRSGFSFDVNRILDTAAVSRVLVESGNPRKIFRPAYNLERYQAKYRCGRVSKGLCTYYQPSDRVPMRIVDLEAVEADAAVFLFKAAGWRPPVELLGSPVLPVGFPRDFVAALRSPVPLAAQAIKLKDKRYLGASYVGVDVAPASARSSTAEVDGECRSVGASSSSSSEAASPSVPDFASVSLRSASPAGTVEFARVLETSQTVPQVKKILEDGSMIADPAVTLDKVFREVGKRSHSMVVGNYYAVPGLPKPQTATVTFPKGLESVARVLDRHEGRRVSQLMSKTDREQALAMALLKYNLTLAEHIALYNLLLSFPLDDFSGKVEFRRLRRLLCDLFEILANLKVDVLAVSSLVVRLVGRSYDLVEIEDLETVQHRFYEQYSDVIAHAYQGTESGWKAAYAGLCLEQIPMATSDSALNWPAVSSLDVFGGNNTGRFVIDLDQVKHSRRGGGSVVMSVRPVKDNVWSRAAVALLPRDGAGLRIKTRY